MGMQPDDQGIFFVLIVQGGPGSGEFIYDANGNLRSANVGQTTTDPVQGITCQQGFSTFNGFGAVINLLSTAPGKAAFFQYIDNQSAVQGALILSVASVASTDPVLGTTYPAGLFGVNPAFGGTLTAVGSVIQFGAPLFTQSGEVEAAVGGGANQPFIATLAPEQGVSGHAVMVMTGVSPDGTKPAQLIVSSQPTGTTVPAPITKALLEVDGSLALVNGSLPAFLSTATQFAAVAGVLTGITGSGGLSGTLPLDQTDATTFTVVAAASTQASKAWSVPAADANVGTEYELVVRGTGTEGSTAQNLSVSVALNGAAIRTVVTPALTASGSFRFKVTIILKIKTTGAGGTAEVSAEGAWSTTATPAVSNPFVTGSSAAGGEAFNTTIANTLQLNVGWASTTGAPTITTLGSRLTRRGP